VSTENLSWGVGMGQDEALFNKFTSVFRAFVLLLIMNLFIILSK